jgi:transposase
LGKIAEVTFTSADRVRDVLHNFNANGFEALYPKYMGGRPRTFTLPERREIKKIAKSKPGRARPAVLDLEPGQAGQHAADECLREVAAKANVA